LVGLAVATAIAQVPPGQRITTPELKKLYDVGRVVVLDVRSAAAYREAHITGALSVPLEQVAAKARELAASGQTVVTYCT
jgi:rhodanese-related sulfurtransferase